MNNDLQKGFQLGDWRVFPDQGLLEGTLYAKWGHTKISGQGTYDAQFIVGSMAIDGQGDVTILFVGGKKGKAPQVFLVE